MGDISPVLQSFLAGKQQALDAAKFAQGVANAKAERDQRQQDLDDVMKRFDVSQKNEQAKIDLMHQTAAQNAQLHLMDMRDKFQDMLKANPSSAPGSFQIPGVNLGGVQTPLSAPIIPPVGMPQTDPISGVQIPMPTSNVADQYAMLPFLKAKDDAEAAAYISKMNPTLQNKLDISEANNERNKEIWQQRIESANQLGDLKAKVAETNANSRLTFEIQKLFGFDDPEQVKNRAANNAALVAKGQMTVGDVANPIERNLTQRALGAAGYSPDVKGVAAKVGGHAVDAESFLQAMDQIHQQLGTPQNLVGSVLNKMSSVPGLNWASPYSSIYNDFTTSVTPGLENALGISVKGASRSPAMMAQMKNITPNPGDNEKVFGEKVAHGLDLHLTAATKELTGLPVNQRKLFFQQMLHDHPTLLKNGIVGPKLVEAANSGNYIPGIQGQ